MHKKSLLFALFSVLFVCKCGAGLNPVFYEDQHFRRPRTLKMETDDNVNELREENNTVIEKFAKENGGLKFLDTPFDQRTGVSDKSEDLIPKYITTSFGYYKYENLSLEKSDVLKSQFQNILDSACSNNLPNILFRLETVLIDCIHIILVGPQYLQKEQEIEKVLTVFYEVLDERIEKNIGLRIFSTRDYLEKLSMIFTNQKSIYSHSFETGSTVPTTVHFFSQVAARLVESLLIKKQNYVTGDDVDISIINGFFTQLEHIKNKEENKAPIDKLLYIFDVYIQNLVKARKSENTISAIFAPFSFNKTKTLESIIKKRPISFSVLPTRLDELSSHGNELTILSRVFNKIDNNIYLKDGQKFLELAEKSQKIAGTDEVCKYFQVQFPQIKYDYVLKDLYGFGVGDILTMILEGFKPNTGNAQPGWNKKVEGLGDMEKEEIFKTYTREKNCNYKVTPTSICMSIFLENTLYNDYLKS